MERCLSKDLERQRQRLAALARSALFREPRSRLNEAAQRLDFAGEALRRAMRDRVAAVRQQVSDLHSSLRQHRPDHLIAIRRHEITGHESQLSFVMKQRLAERRQQLQRMADLLRLLSPQATLERGYTITTGPDGELLKSVQDAQPGLLLTTRFQDGVAESEVKTMK
jgi:exodeoxyribonuclease VII large subunit